MKCQRQNTFVFSYIESFKDRICHSPVAQRSNTCHEYRTTRSRPGYSVSSHFPCHPSKCEIPCRRTVLSINQTTFTLNYNASCTRTQTMHTFLHARTHRDRYITICNTFLFKKNPKATTYLWPSSWISNTNCLPVPLVIPQRHLGSQIVLRYASPLRFITSVSL